MTDWLSEQYLLLVANFRVLLFNPSQCYAVEALQALSLLLAFLVIVRIGINSAVTRILKSRFKRFSVAADGELLSLYHQSAAEVGVRRVPELYRFANLRPPAFTVGVWKQSIFLAPRLVESLRKAELRSLLIHELTHAKRRDNLRGWFWEVFFSGIPALVIQFFALNFILSNLRSGLAIWGAILTLALFRIFALRPIQSFRERLCDDLTVGTTGDRLMLARSLVTVWRLSHRWPRYRWQQPLGAVQSFLGGRNEPEARIRRLLSNRKLRFTLLVTRLRRAAVAVCLLLGTAFLLWFYSSDYPHRQPMGFDCLTTERIFASDA